jgi:hypothetical protein
MRGVKKFLGVPVGESDRPADERPSDEPGRFPPPEWGRERSPVVDKLISVVVAVVGVAAVVGLAVWGFTALRVEDVPPAADRQATVQETTPAPTETPRGANEANVGDCVAVVKAGMDAELEVLECGTPDAVYRVAVEIELGEKCPKGPYTEYSVIGMGGWSLCLALDATPGQCFKTNLAKGFAAADCAAADVKVTSVLTGKADGDACPPPPSDVAFYPAPLVYPSPPLTICLADVPK